MDEAVGQAPQSCAVPVVLEESEGLPEPALPPQLVVVRCFLAVHRTHLNQLLFHPDLQQVNRR